MTDQVVRGECREKVVTLAGAWARYNPDEFWTVAELGHRLGVNLMLITNWIKQGRLWAIRVRGPGRKGRLLIPKCEGAKARELAAGYKRGGWGLRRANWRQGLWR